MDEVSNIPVEWAKIDRSIAETYGYTPQQIHDLTLTEKWVLCQPAELSADEQQKFNGEVAYFVNLYNEASIETKLEYNEFERRMMS